MSIRIRPLEIIRLAEVPIAPANASREELAMFLADVAEGKKKAAKRGMAPDFVVEVNPNVLIAQERIAVRDDPDSAEAQAYMALAKRIAGID